MSDYQMSNNHSGPVVLTLQIINMQSRESNLRLRFLLLSAAMTGVTCICQRHPLGRHVTPAVACKAAWSPFGRGAPHTQAKPLQEPALDAWLKQQQLPQQQVALSDCGLEGRGLVATERIRKGTHLLRVPEQLVLTPDAALRRSALQKELAQADPWTVLAVFLLEALGSKGEGSAGSWLPYAQVLPQRTNGVLEWPKLQVDHFLKGSPLHATAQGILASAQGCWQEAEPLLADAAQRGLIVPELATRTKFDWALSMLLSRLVRLPGRSNVEAMIPWADFVNHSCTAGSHLDWSPEQKAVTLRCEQNYAAGEQVLASYGQKTSGVLLLSYGFVPQDNPFDSVQLTLALDKDDSLFQLKQRVLAQHGLRAAEAFPLKLDGLPRGVLQYAAFAAAIPSDVNEMEPLADYLFNKGQFPKLDHVDTEGLAVEFAITSIRSALAGYSTTIETDKQTLAHAAQQLKEQGQSQEGTVLKREIAATTVRLKEQQTLHKSLFNLQQQKRELRAQTLRSF